MATTINYSYDYFLRSIYSSNRDARKPENRPTLSNKELVQADSDAMKKITEKLRDIEYSTDNASEVLNNVKLFIDTYNNLIDSTGSSTSEELNKLKKQITSLTKENKDELEDLGISIKASGKLDLDKTVFGKCNPSKIERFFGSDTDFMNNLRSYSSQAKRTARRMIDPTEIVPETKKKPEQAAAIASDAVQATSLAEAELMNSLLKNPENGSTFDAKG